MEEGIAIEVPQILSASEIGPLAETPDPAAEEGIAIEVPQVLSASKTGTPTATPDQAVEEAIAIQVTEVPSAVEAGPPTQPSDQALSDASLLDRKEDEEEEEEAEEAGEEEEEKMEEEDEEEHEDEDGKLSKAKAPATHDQTRWLPEYMIAESVCDLPTVDGKCVSFCLWKKVVLTLCTPVCGVDRLRSIRAILSACPSWHQH